MRHPILLLVLGISAACASPQMRVRSALVDIGVKPTVADCMAGEMTDRLSLAQLQKLGRAGSAGGDGAAPLGPAELVALANRIGDPEVIAVTTTAGLLCSVGY